MFLALVVTDSAVAVRGSTYVRCEASGVTEVKALSRPADGAVCTAAAAADEWVANGVKPYLSIIPSNKAATDNS